MPFLVKTKLGEVVLDIIYRINFAQTEFQKAVISLRVSLLNFQNVVKAKGLKYVKCLARNHNLFT